MKNLQYHFEKRYYTIVIVFGILLLLLNSARQFTFNSPKETSASLQFSSVANSNSKEIQLKNFNPNDYSENDWKNIGFTDKQVKTILKYKDIVGGEFISKAQLKKCYAISEEKFAQLDAFIELPDENPKNSYANNFHSKNLNISVKFNPDYYSIEDWTKLGFSEKQSAGILKYKNYLGGSFQSKEKFKECYFISPENYQKLSPYLILPEKSEQNNSKNPKIQLAKFDPNQLDVSGWSKLGFTEKQANVIVNYRDKNLKGSFRNIEDIEKCFVISPEKFSELKPYIQLNPSNISSAVVAAPKQETDYSKIDLNKITYKQLIEYGFDERAAGSFVGFRKKLGGFVNTNQILDTYNIDKELTQKLINTAQLNTENIEKYSLVDAPEEWLKNHPYFKYSADRIIFYRISNPDDRKIWKFLKLKPEYETRMRWYVK